MPKDFSDAESRSAEIGGSSFSVARANMKLKYFPATHTHGDWTLAGLGDVTLGIQGFPTTHSF